MKLRVGSPIKRKDEFGVITELSSSGKEACIIFEDGRCSAWHRLLTLDKAKFSVLKDEVIL